jgi:hypothetical protein
MILRSLPQTHAVIAPDVHSVPVSEASIRLPYKSKTGVRHQLLVTCVTRHTFPICCE